MAAAVALTTAAGPLSMPQHAPVAQLVAHATQPSGAAAASVILAEQVVVDDIEATQPVRYDPCADGALCAQGDGPVCPPTGLAVERGLSSDALRVLRCLAAQFPQVATFYGVGARPNESDHPSGRAVDAMIPNWYTPSGNALGWQVAQWARVNQACLSVTYVIWDAMIWSADRPADGWRPYRHPNGWLDANSLHLNHVHISVRGSAGSCADGTQAVSLPGDDLIAANHSFDRASSEPTRTAASLYPDPEQPASPAPYEPARKPEPGPTQDDAQPDPTSNPDSEDGDSNDPDGENSDEGDTGDDDPSHDNDDQGEPADEPGEPEEPADEPEPEDPEGSDNNGEDDPNADEPDDEPEDPDGAEDTTDDEESGDPPEDADNPDDETGGEDDTESGDEPVDTESGDEPDEPAPGDDDEEDEATNSS